MSDKVLFGPAGSKCNRCGAENVWTRNRKTGQLFPGCPNYARGCKPNAGDMKAEVNPIPQPQQAMGALETAILNAILPSLQDKFGAMKDEIANLVGDAIDSIEANGHTRTIEWKVNDQPFAKMEGKCHNALSLVLRRVKAGLKNLLVVGPAGSGKSTLASDLAKSMSLNFASVSCSAGMSEWYLTGRSLPNLQTGHSVYQTSDFIRLYENGGVFLCDELDAADANVMIVINSALANGYLNIPARVDNPVAKRHKDFYFVGAANTFGTGATMMYVGRNQLDAATLDRFSGAVVSVGYDMELETSLVPEKDIRECVWKMRENVEVNRIRRIVGTRSLLACAALVRSGETLKDAACALMVGWAQDEVGKVMNGVRF
jgi:cobaltochelatase CobS